MQVVEPDPAIGKAIQGRRGDFAAERADVREAHVVGDNEENVGRGGGGLHRRLRGVLPGGGCFRRFLV